MKKLSLIIVNSKKTDNKDVEANSLSLVKEELFGIFHDLQNHNFLYEVIFVTDDASRMPLEDIEIFPKMTPITYHLVDTNTTMSAMVDQGVALAKYDQIAVLGSTAGYMPKNFGAILADIANGIDVVAAVPADASSLLPFQFKMYINPYHSALFFSKNVWDIIHFDSQNDTRFLLEFIKRSQDAGFSFKKYQIPSVARSLLPNKNFSIRKMLTAAKDIFSLNANKSDPIYLTGEDENTMINSGLIYNKQKYITHTKLNATHSALQAISPKRVLTWVVIFGILIELFILNPLLFVQVFIGLLSSIYLIDVCFNVFLVFKTFKDSPELSFSQEELNRINDEQLPVYTILCPLYKEVHILPQFIKGLEKIEWPKEKLDVIILLESDDTDSIEKFNSMSVPSYMRAIVVPNSTPKTKPKACNYGLDYAKGEYTVIYDAEDIPDPWQLKKAYLGFQTLGEETACIQAKLNYYNADQNLLTRFFTAEYSLWFDIVLTSLASLKTVIPLGGTSNHFRTNDLKKLNAWDPFNVTEDADLGLRLFKLGYQTAVLDSVTLEEGNSQVGNWIRQRSRWIKGYMQTYLVHTKENLTFFKERGIHALIFHLVIGGKLAFIILNPFLWIVTLLYFGLYSIVGPTIDTFYPPFVLYVAITSLIFGNSLYLFCHIMGCVKTERWGLIKYVFLIPMYWILISIAGFMALYQLVFKPFYWEKTVHGLHLKDNFSLSNALGNSKSMNALA